MAQGWAHELLPMPAMRPGTDGGSADRARVSVRLRLVPGVLGGGRDTGGAVVMLHHATYKRMRAGINRFWLWVKA